MKARLIRYDAKNGYEEGVMVHSIVMITKCNNNGGTLIHLKNGDRILTTTNINTLEARINHG